MPLISNRELETTYTSPDGSIYIDFDAIDKELEADSEEEEDDDEE